MKSIIAENVKKILQQQGTKQNFLAEKAGYKIGTFSNMMNGRKTITPFDIIKLCDVLNVTPNDLFSIGNQK